MEDLDIKQLAEDLKNNQYTSFSASKISEKIF